MAQPKKSQTDQFVDDLLRYVQPDYFEDTGNRAAFAAANPGAPLPPRARIPGSDASNPRTGDEPGPASEDANGIYAVNAVDSQVDFDDLDALNADVSRLQDTTKARRAADATKAGQPESDAAIRQAALDKAQAAIGKAQRLSRVTQGGIRDRVFNTADRLGAISTPGGITALLLILALLVLVLRQTNGQPRLVWLWLVLTRKAHLMSESEASGVSATVGGSESGVTPTENPAPSFSAAGILANNSGTYAHQQNSQTPINISFGAGLLNSASSALDRYINP